ncbi:MAG: hypothetical protein ACXVXC_12790 [Nocardioidaceae bacterium]
MLVLGLLLVLAAVVAAVAVLAGGGNDPASYSVGSLHVSTNVLTVFVFGALTLLVLMVGLMLMRSGAARANQRRKDARKLKRLTAQAEQQDAERTRTDDRAAATGNTTEIPAGGTTTGPAPTGQHVADDPATETTSHATRPYQDPPAPGR